MKILSSIRDDAAGQLVITVHLDETRLDENGQPDSAWVADPYAWSLEQTNETLPDGTPNPAYIPFDEWLASVLVETRLLAEQELARRLALLDAPTEENEPGGTELGLQF